MVKPTRTYPTALLYTLTRNSPRPSLCLTTGYRATYPPKETIQVAKVLYTLSAVEVWEEVEICVIVFALGEDTRDDKADIGLCVVSNDDGVHNKSEEGILVRCGILL